MNIVMIGLGKIGKNMLSKLSNKNHVITIIDRDKDKVESLVEKYDVYGISGNGACMEVQKGAKVQEADLVIILTSNDELNILACLVAKELGASNTIVRISNPDYRDQIFEMREKIGISMVLNPEKETADEIVRLIISSEIELKNVMIVGGGETGYYLANELAKKKYIVKLIENDEHRAEEMAEALPKVNVIYADGTKPYILLEEGIRHVDAFVALTGIDEENIIVSMYAGKQNVRKIITKVNRNELLSISEKIGIQDNVSPKDIVASKVIEYIRLM